MQDVSQQVISTKPTARSAVTNGSVLLQGVDGRSIWARRARDLIEAHVADLGGYDLCSEAERSIIVERVIERPAEPPKKEEKKWYQKAGTVVLVIGALLAGLLAAIQIVESDTFKNIFGGAGETQVEEQVNPPTQPGEDADSTRVVGEGVDTTDAVNQ